MGKEIERKFLVSSDSWAEGAAGTPIRQGYLSSQPERTVRVRLAGGKATLTIKGLSRGATRDEYEYEIPKSDADLMLDQLCERPILEKTRYRVPFRGLTWEVDVFGGDNEGLVVAEVELGSEDQAVELPPWVGREVTGEPRYSNSNLVRKPFKSW
jgi:adenylate cyclase